MTDDELHLAASGYSNNRKNAYIELMKKGKVKKLSKDMLNWLWVAFYEGYREGHWVATGDDRYTTDPAKLKEKNT